MVEGKLVLDLMELVVVLEALRVVRKRVNGATSVMLCGKFTAMRAMIVAASMLMIPWSMDGRHYIISTQLLRLLSVPDLRTRTSYEADGK